jgi:integrase
MASKKSRYTYHEGGVLSYVRTSDGKRVYCARYYYQGRRIVEKVGFVEDTARGIAATRRRLIDEDPSYVPPKVKRARAAKGRVRFKVFATEFLKNHGALRKSEKTFFVPMTNRLVRELGELYLDAMTAGRVQGFIAARARAVGPSTVNHDLRFLKCMLSRAAEWGYLSENPIAKVRGLKEPPARELFLSQAESNKLLELAQPHVRPVVRFALLTGCRRGEILGLTWDAVSLERRTIYLRDTKNNEARALPVGDDLLALLEARPKHVSTDHVFTRYGKPLASLQGSWETARARLVAAVREGDAARGIPGDPERAAELEGFRFHDLRHTWASRQVAAGSDLYTLMKLGGWKTASMVGRYAHFAADYLRAAANRLNGTAGAVPVAAEGESQVAALVAGHCRS